MMNLPTPKPGCCFVVVKATNEVMQIPQSDFNPEKHNKVHYADLIGEAKPDPVPPVPVPEVVPPKEEAKQPSSGFTKEELGMMSSRRLKSLPEFEVLKSQNFKDKESLITAIIAAREAKE